MAVVYSNLSISWAPDTFSTKCLTSTDEHRSKYRSKVKDGA